MFISFENTDGKPTYSHTSLLDEEKQQQIKKIYQEKTWWRNGCLFLTFYGMMEAVNRLSFLKAKTLLWRIPYVIVPLCAAPFVVDKFYWDVLGKKKEAMKHLVGAPIYNDKHRLPELDKLYFFLDDDKNYEPSLLHHGTYDI